jgi:hypothetical protein
MKNSSIVYSIPGLLGDLIDNSCRWQLVLLHNKCKIGYTHFSLRQDGWCKWNRTESQVTILTIKAPSLLPLLDTMKYNVFELLCLASEKVDTYTVVD